MTPAGASGLGDYWGNSLVGGVDLSLLSSFCHLNGVDLSCSDGREARLAEVGLAGIGAEEGVVLVVLPFGEGQVLAANAKLTTGY